MKLPIRNPGLAAALSFLVPGLGQAVGGKAARGLVICLPAVAFLFVFVPTYFLANSALVGSVAGLTALFVVNVLACGYHVWAVVDAYRVIKPPFKQLGMRGIPDRRPTILLEFALLLVLVVATFALHAGIGYADYNSCTMRGRSCVAAATTPPPISAGSPSPSASVDPSQSGPTPEPTPEPAPSATPLRPGMTVMWEPVADRIRVHTEPKSAATTIVVLRETQRITGVVVQGGSYTFAGGTYTDWIHIDKGQPGAGGYVAAEYFVQVGATAAPATPTAPPTPTPTPTLGG